MKTFVLAVFPVAAGLFLFPGCSGDTGPQGPAGPSLTGSISSRVVVLATDGRPDPDQAGVTVRIEGSSDSTLTDSLGRWTLTNVSTGIHTIRAEKAGYGLTMFPSTQFAGGKELSLEQRLLVKDPSFTVPPGPLIWSHLSSMGVLAGAVSNTSSSNRPVLVYVGRGPIDPLDPSTYIGTAGGTSTAGSNVFNSEPMALAAAPYNFAQGDTMFFMIFAQSSITWGYTDPVTGAWVISTGRQAAGVSVHYTRP